MVNIFVKEVATSFGELQQKWKCFALRNVTIFFEVAFEVAEWSDNYPPEQY